MKIMLVIMLVNMKYFYMLICKYYSFNLKYLKSNVYIVILYLLSIIV